MMHKTLEPLTLDQALARAAEYYGYPLELVYSRRREPHLVRVRWAAWLALSRRGYSIMQIAQHAGRDHSTVLYGLTRARRDRELLSVAEYIAGEHLPAFPPASLLRFGRRDAHEVLAYLRMVVGEAPWSTAAVFGCRLIAGSIQLQAEVEHLIQWDQWPDHYWRIRVHAGQIGAYWVSSGEGQNLDKPGRASLESTINTRIALSR